MDNLSATSTQIKVREAMKQVGGYWRPLAAAARVLEELGELAEELEKETLDTDALRGELADLWIITTAMADQFLAFVAEPGTESIAIGEWSDLFWKLVAAGGRIARIVNYYDGPKSPRSLDDWIPLGDAVAAFHRVLASIAEQESVDLAGAVDEKLEAIPTRDADRFLAAHDGSTAAILDHFRQIQDSVLCPYSKNARLWGAPIWVGDDLGKNVDAMVPSLEAFSKAATPECLDGYVVSGPKFESMGELATWFRRMLLEISARDPRQRPVMKGAVDRTGWQFEFNGLRLFAAVFSPLYDSGHPRHSPTYSFIFFQTDESFDRHGVGSKHPKSAQVKDQIRKLFAAAGRGYPAEPKDARVEAPLYLLPRWEGDSEVRWWEDLKA